MKPRILLVNPPIYDFAAYDFWLKPYGMLSVAGYLRGKADFILFDFLDRQHSFMREDTQLQNDRYGRGRFFEERIQSPACLLKIPRYFRRYGLPRQFFREMLAATSSCDYVFIATGMTYWYLGVGEVIEDVRKSWPAAKIVLGGNYATLCKEHAEKLGAELLVSGNNLKKLWDFLKIEPDLNQPALWEAYDKLKTGVLKLSDGCPFNCTYCSVPKVYGKFKPRPMARALDELELLIKQGVENIAFYDDALLYSSENVLIPFLNEVIKRNISVRGCLTAKVNFHTPNAINACLVTEELAELMVTAGFKTFYIGFESASKQWQQKTGAKVFSSDLQKAVKHLTKAGVDGNSITVYQIVGHPLGDIQELEESMYFVNSLGVRGMLADFSPIPGTPDGYTCQKWVDMNEPLMHNKAAFAIIKMGFDELNRFKELQRQLNRKLKPTISDQTKEA
jgi:radical SAM superfamily enzyme YgiQ (UPF0313 family)